MDENETLVLGELKKVGNIELNSLKEKVGLSNKQWDKAIKGLRKHGVINVSKIEETLNVELIEA